MAALWSLYGLVVVSLWSRCGLVVVGTLLVFLTTWPDLASPQAKKRPTNGSEWRETKKEKRGGGANSRTQPLSMAMKTKINSIVMTVMLTTNSDMLGNPVGGFGLGRRVGEVVLVFGF